MQQNNIIRIIEEAAPPQFAADWDKSGVQVASGRSCAQHLAVCLDPAPEMVRRALDFGADMILAHHPLSMSPRYPDTPDAYHRVLSLLFSRDVLLYSAHTSLDANPEGPASWLPDELGLSGRDFLEKTGAMTRPDGSILQGGIGCVGDLPAPLAPADLFRRIAALLPLDRMNAETRLAGSLPDKITRVAVCAGSGASLAEEAMRKGADILITGDMRYHAALDIVTMNSPEQGRYRAAGAPARQASGFAVLDVGHFALEEEMMCRMAALLTARMPEVTVTFLPGRDPFQPCGLTHNTPEGRP